VVTAQALTGLGAAAFFMTFLVAGFLVFLGVDLALVAVAFLGALAVFFRIGFLVLAGFLLAGFLVTVLALVAFLATGAAPSCRDKRQNLAM